MAAELIHYYDRYTKTVETENVYGERWLRWTYGSSLGQMALNAIVKRALFSRWYGWRMDRSYSANLVLPFIVKYKLDVKEFQKSPFKFKSFNDFFVRALTREARPVDADPNSAVFPADGRHLAIQNVDAAEGFYVKGAKFSLADLLGNKTLAELFTGGSMLISRLCPVDYHRFHFPVAGIPDEARLIKGWLYSVSPLALRGNIRYLVENKRFVTQIASEKFGTVAMLEVGATCVGTIREQYVAGQPVAKGEEKGLFKFGGSCVITLFQAGRFQFDADVLEQSAEGRETYAKVGDRMGLALGS